MVVVVVLPFVAVPDQVREEALAIVVIVLPESQKPLSSFRGVCHCCSQFSAATTIATTIATEIL